MSIHSLPQLPAPALPLGALYYADERPASPAPRLRTLTALEQMYAYWGSDRK